MKDFIHTGFHAPTMTTANDPKLVVTEVDNGRTWLMHFEVGDRLIDMINMEHVRGSEIHQSVRSIRVIDDEGKDIGSVEDRLKYAIDLNYLEHQAFSYEPEYPQ